MTIFLISDTHFQHENIYKFVGLDGITRIRSQFANATEGDEYMIDRWNTVVSPEDHVWHLGDVSMGRTADQQATFIRTIRSLHGHKRLVLGNHDYFPMHVYAAAGIQMIVSYHRHAGLVYSHVPLHPMSVESNKIIANIHGHIHERPSPPGKYVNVSVERIHYTPIPLDEVLVLARKANEFQD